MKNAVIFLLGVAVGCAGTYLYLNKKMLNELNEEEEKLIEHYKMRETEPTSTAEESRNKPDIMDYANYFFTKHKDLDKKEDNTKEEDTVGKSNSPRLIKKEEYYNDGMYNKVALSYYAFNDVLFNEEEGEVVDDVSALVGDTLTKYGFDESEEEVIRVRNYETMTDYEIEKIFASYS